MYRGAYIEHVWPYETMKDHTLQFWPLFKKNQWECKENLILMKMD